MSNTLTAIMPKILARSLIVLRQKVVMPRIVNGDYSTEARQKGDVINVPVPVERSATDVSPSNTPPTPTSTATRTVPVTLDQWKHSDFHLTDDQLGHIDKNQHFIPMEMEEAVKAIANAINVDIFSDYLGVYGFVGPADDSAPVDAFAVDVTPATHAIKLLNQQVCPKQDRRAVIDFTQEANALALAPFRDVSASSDRNVVIEGEIGRKYGMDWFSDHHVPTHTTGTLSDGTDHAALVAANVAIGDTTLGLDATSLTGTLLVGDIFTVAGDDQTYVVTANTASGNYSGSTGDNGGYTAGSNAIASVTFQPAAKVAWADGDKVTVKATHTVGLAFHRDAFAYAMRPLISEVADMELGHRIISLRDPLTGLVMRLEVSRQYKQTVWDLDCLWGADLVRPAMAVRIAGKPGTT